MWLNHVVLTCFCYLEMYVSMLPISHRYSLYDTVKPKSDSLASADSHDKICKVLLCWVKSETAAPISPLQHFSLVQCSSTLLADLYPLNSVYHHLLCLGYFFLRRQRWLYDIMQWKAMVWEDTRKKKAPYSLSTHFKKEGHSSIPQTLLSKQTHWNTELMLKGISVASKFVCASTICLW